MLTGDFVAEAQLVAMWDARARVSPEGTCAEVSAGTDDPTIGCLMSPQVLWWRAAAEAGETRYRDVAPANAERTAPGTSARGLGRWQGR